MSTDESKEYVLRMAKEQDVKFIRLWFTDILGTLKSVAITVEELEGALEDGVGFDGSSIEGFARIDESDMVAMPDPNTFVILPWRPAENRVARVVCDILHPGGQPFEGDPRYILKRNLKRAADLGYTFYVAPELEYFYFANAEGTTVLDRGGYFDLTPLDAATDLRRETVLALEEVAQELQKEHPSIQHWSTNIDAQMMWLTKNPEDYGVIVAGNMFGDIVSDAFAGLVGGLGFACSGNIGDEVAVFEPTHGSAPKYEALDPPIVNPIAMVLSAAMLLDHVGETDRASRVRSAVATVVEEGKVRSYDMMKMPGSAEAIQNGAATTDQMADAIIEALG